MAMDTILVVNAGSSSVKFQVFALDGDGLIRRQLKGQVDGIGTLPRLRATGFNGETLADFGYSLERVADVPAALMVAGFLAARGTPGRTDRDWAPRGSWGSRL
jgi:acetate kinase